MKQINKSNAVNFNQFLEGGFPFQVERFATLAARILDTGQSALYILHIGHLYVWIECALLYTIQINK